MDFRKLDAVLSAELSGEPDHDLAVFVHVAESLGPEDAERAGRHLGLERPVTPGAVLSATLPPERIRELSGEPWVVVIRAARRLRPLP